MAEKLRFPEFKNDWEERRFDELFEIKNGLNKGKDFFGSGIKILNYMDVNKNIFNDENSIKGLVDVTPEEISRYTVKHNDLFFTRTSETSEEIGLTSAYIGRDMDCVFSGFILRVRAKIKNINSLFYAYYFRNPMNRQKIIKHSSITTRALISGSSLSAMKINLISINEQKKIANFLSATDKKITLLEDKLNYFEDFKKFCMQQIFAQKLRFKNDDGDNFSDWEEKRLQDVIVVKKGTQLNKSNMINDGKYYVLNGGTEPSGHTNDWNTRENTITISEGGNSCGYVNFNKEKFWSGGHCYYVNQLKANIHNLFLFQELKYLQISIMKLRVGSGLPNIQKGDIENFKIKVPDFEEQEKIANFLINIDNKIDQTSVELENMKKFKKGLLQQMFSYLLIEFINILLNNKN